MAEYFPNVTDFQAIVHPAVGHAINLSMEISDACDRCRDLLFTGYNATGAYAVMLGYLKTHGL